MDKFFSLNPLGGVVVHLLFVLFLLFSFSLFSYNPPSTIHLDMSSKKVPTKRNQLEVIFKAYTEGERVPGNFVPYAPDGEITDIFLQVFLLRDIYDFKNHPTLDGSKDQIYLPIEQMFHCLKGRVDDVLKIKPFIDAMINDNDYEIKCTGSDENRNSLKKLVNYYMPNTYQDIP